MARRTDPLAAVVRQVRERDLGRCARCGHADISRPLTSQHRVGRGMGGSRADWINQPQNLLTLCGSGTTGCHGWVEHHPREAQAHGWAVSRYAGDPAGVPAWTWRGWLMLHADGTASELEDYQGVAGCPCGCRPAPDRAGWVLEDDYV